VGWWLRRRERGRRVGVFCLRGVWLSQYRFTSARFIPHFAWRKMWCGCVGSSRLEGLGVVVSARGTEWSVVRACSGCVSTSFRGWRGGLGHRAWQLGRILRGGEGWGVRFEWGNAGRGGEVDFGDPSRQLALPSFADVDVWVVVWVVCPDIWEVIVEALAAQ